MRIEPEKLYLIERRNQIIFQLKKEGFSGGDISIIMNGLDRTWISRIVKMKISKHKKG